MSKKATTKTKKTTSKGAGAKAKSRSANAAGGTTERLRKAVLAEVQGRIAASETSTKRVRKQAFAEVQAHMANGATVSEAMASPAGKVIVETSAADRKTKAAKEPKPKRVSCLDAAATVLAAANRPMNSHEMILAMAEQGLWTSPGGKTPAATLYAAITREIAAKGSEARFTKRDSLIAGTFASTKGN